MTWLSLIGCALIAYALPSSMIYFIILRRPQLMIVFLFGFVHQYNFLETLHDMT